MQNEVKLLIQEIEETSNRSVFDLEESIAKLGEMFPKLTEKDKLEVLSRLRDRIFNMWYASTFIEKWDENDRLDFLNLLSETKKIPIQTVIDHFYSYDKFLPDFFSKIQKYFKELDFIISNFGFQYVEEMFLDLEKGRLYYDLKMDDFVKIYPLIDSSPNYLQWHLIFKSELQGISYIDVYKKIKSKTE